MSDLSQAPPARFAFSTRLLPERDRLAIWREEFGPKILNLDVANLHPELPYEAELSILPLRGLVIADALTIGTRTERTQSFVGDGRDDFVFVIAEEGGGTLSQCGRVTTLRNAGATILASAIPSLHVTPEHFSFLALSLPYQELAARVRNLEDQCACQVPADNVPLQLLRIYARKLFNCTDTELTPEFHHTGVRHIHDLAALVLGATGDAAEEARGRGLRFGRLLALKKIVAQNLGRGDLSTKLLAAKLRISESYVRSLFEHEGASPHAYILDQRLALARRRFADPTLRDRTIAAIAYETGFNDLSYFNRAFRRRFGGTPSDMRAAAEGEPDGESGHS